MDIDNTMPVWYNAGINTNGGSNALDFLPLCSRLPPLVPPASARRGVLPGLALVAAGIACRRCVPLSAFARRSCCLPVRGAGSGLASVTDR